MRLLPLVEGLTIGFGSQALIRSHVDGLRDKLHRAITKHELGAACMQAFESDFGGPGAPRGTAIFALRDSRCQIGLATIKVDRHLGKGAMLVGMAPAQPHMARAVGPHFTDEDGIGQTVGDIGQPGDVTGSIGVSIGASYIAGHAAPRIGSGGIVDIGSRDGKGLKGRHQRTGARGVGRHACGRTTARMIVGRRDLRAARIDQHVGVAGADIARNAMTAQPHPAIDTGGKRASSRGQAISN